MLGIIDEDMMVQMFCYLLFDDSFQTFPTTDVMLIGLIGL